jgi:hypothetical protein
VGAAGLVELNENAFLERLQNPETRDDEKEVAEYQQNLRKFIPPDVHKLLQRIVGFRHSITNTRGTSRKTTGHRLAGKPTPKGVVGLEPALLASSKLL